MAEWVTTPEAVMYFRLAESQLVEYSSRGSLGTKISGTKLSDKGERRYRRSQLKLIPPDQTDRLSHETPNKSWGQLGTTKLGKLAMFESGHAALQPCPIASTKKTETKKNRVLTLAPAMMGRLTERLRSERIEPFNKCPLNPKREPL